MLHHLEVKISKGDGKTKPIKVTAIVDGDSVSDVARLVVADDVILKGFVSLLGYDEKWIWFAEIRTVADESVYSAPCILSVDIINDYVPVSADAKGFIFVPGVCVVLHFEHYMLNN